jgi:hypothetical protein
MSDFENFETKNFEFAELIDNVRENKQDSSEGVVNETKESLIDSLDLNDAEKNVLDNISFTGAEAVKNFSGTVKVEGDCTSTTCTYTETYYSCPSTEPS